MNTNLRQITFRAPCCEERCVAAPMPAEDAGKVIVALCNDPFWVGRTVDVEYTETLTHAPTVECAGGFLKIRKLTDPMLPKE